MTSQTICDDVKQSICWPVQKMYFGAGFSVFSPNMWKCRQPVLDVLSVKLEREQLLKKSIFGRTKKIWRLHCWLQTFSGHWKQEAINKKIFHLIRQFSCDCFCSRPAVGDPLTEIQQKWYTAYRLIQTQFQGQLLCLSCGEFMERPARWRGDCTVRERFQEPPGSPLEKPAHALRANLPEPLG